MTEAKTYASLSSGLLARKGGAKPAMRPQAFGQVAPQGDELGWNDMGAGDCDLPEHVPSSIAALTPSPGGRGHAVPAPQPEPRDERQADPGGGFDPEAEAEAGGAMREQPPAGPPVLEQQRALEARYQVEPAAVVALPPRRFSSVPGARPAGAKAAFTLRLDPDRHLKLRLACAVTRRSAQQIVTEALDELLDRLPEVDALARRVPAGVSKRAG